MSASNSPVAKDLLIADSLSSAIIFAVLARELFGSRSDTRTVCAFGAVGGGGGGFRRSRSPSIHAAMLSGLASRAAARLPPSSSTATPPIRRRVPAARRLSISMSALFASSVLALWRT
jgi:hypothetical protein